MAIKGGSIVQAGNAVMLDRVQTGGPGQVNIQATQIYELGNHQALGYIYDTPDVSYSLDSADATAELEAVLTGHDYTTAVAGDQYDLATMKCMDVLANLTGETNAAAPYDTIGSVVAPYLTCEKLSYSFGLTQNGSINGSLRGDSVFYSPGSAYTEEFATSYTVTNKVLTSNVATLTIGAHKLKVGDSFTATVVAAPFAGTFTLTAVTGTTISYAVISADVASVVSTGTVKPNSVTLTNPAYVYNGDVISGARYALSVAATDNQRYRYAVDYTETVTGAGVTKTVKVVLTGTITPASGSKIRVSYTSDTVAQYLQNTHPVDSAVRPSAIRGRNVVVKIGGVIWTDMQSISLDWSIQLDKDEELGNSQIVSQDYDVPSVSGNVVLKPRSVAALLSKLKIVTGAATATEVMGALQKTPLTIEVILYSPTDGSVLKTVYCPDAQFTIPGFSGQVKSKTNITMNFSSLSGSLSAYKGAKP